MVKPENMRRTDGSRIVQVRHPSWKKEFISLFVALKTDPWIVLLFPMFFASNYFYTWRPSSFVPLLVGPADSNVCRIQRLQRRDLYDSGSRTQQLCLLDCPNLRIRFHWILHPR